MYDNHIMEAKLGQTLRNQQFVLSIAQLGLQQQRIHRGRHTRRINN
jgi:hypothetical protein